MKKELFVFKVRDIVEIALLCALGIVLDRFVKIPIGANGGSINISLVPIYIVSLRHGWFKGFFAGGLIYGLITCLLDGYGFNTYPFDYLVAFGCTCILGAFTPYIYKNFNKSPSKTVLCFVVVICCVLLSGIIRILSSSINSVLFYETTYVGGIIYNWYMVPTAISNAIIVSLLLYLIMKLSKVFPTTYTKSFHK